MPTTNPVPSTDPTDLLFNAGKLDEVVNGTANSFTDRLGIARRTVAGMNADFDAQLADAESDLNVYRADAAASAAEALGYLQTIRATSYGAYAEDPTTDPLGNPPTVGDEYFNTTAKLLKRWNGMTWQASDINTANLASPSGSSLVGYMPAGTGAVATTVENKLREQVSIFDYLNVFQRNDVINGTKLLDISAAINAALGELGNNAELFFPPYDYRVSDTITMPSTKYWQKIRGVSAPEGGGGAGVKSRLDFSLLPANKTAIVAGGKSYIEDIGVFGPGATLYGTYTGVKSDESDVWMKNVTIQGFNIGCSVRQTWYSRLENVSFRFNSLGLKADTYHNLSLIGCAFGGSSIEARPSGQETGNAILLVSGGECSIKGGSIEGYWGVGGYGINVLSNNQHLNLNDVYFEPYGDSAHPAGPAVLVSGSGSSVNAKGCYVYTYYQDAFIYLSDNTFNYTLTSIGNRFANSTTHLGLIYRLPASESYRKSGTIFIAGDNLKDITGAQPVYISPDLINAKNGQPNCTVYPPRLGIASSEIKDHDFIGRPQANPVLDAAPAAPLKGVIYWANGTSWNPATSEFSPYPVVWDGSSYRNFIKPAYNLAFVQSATHTLTQFQNVVVSTSVNPVTVFLPATPVNGDRHTIKLYNGANSLTIDSQGVGIDGSGTTRVINGGTTVAMTLEYNLYLGDWIILSNA